MSKTEQLSTLAALPLRVGISTRALFELEAEHAIFEDRGIDAYVQALRERETGQIGKGPGFGIVARLLGLNEVAGRNLVEVILLSRNAPNASLPAFAAIELHGLKICTGSFTGGRPVGPFAQAWHLDLFMSRNTVDVEAVAAAGVAAATLGAAHVDAVTAAKGLRIALDGDAVVFSDASERVFERHGLQAFLRHEAANVMQPMAAGPFANALQKFAALRSVCRDAGRPEQIRIALVTSRTAPAHARVIHTLRAWGVDLDEAHFVGAAAKAGVLAAFGADIFFDDQAHHVLAASSVVASGLVPRGGADKRATDATLGRRNRIRTEVAREPAQPCRSRRLP